MSKEENTPFVPPSEQEIMLIQPNNVTFGQYNISEWQENLLTLISDRIQKHITREQELPRDLFNQPYVEIVCDEAGGLNNKVKVVAEAKKMLRKEFSFRWVHPKIHQTIETTGLIITTIHNVKGSNRIMLNLNPWAIPFLLYYGQGVGGTQYNKGIALKLKGNYTKRIYKIICSQQDRSEYFYNIEQFRKDFEIPDSYENAQIEQKILKPSKERIKAINANVWFDYKMICRTPEPGRKPKADTIIFLIQTQHPALSKGEQYDRYAYVYRWISVALGHRSDSTVDNIITKIIQAGRQKDVYDRIAFYDGQVCSGEKTKEHAINSILKMLREDFGIKTPRKK